MLENVQKRKRKKKGMCLADRPMVEANAAGIDIGAREIYVAVPPDRDQEPVRMFASFTEDIQRLADWLESCGVQTVAMESTGVYWIPLYEILEARGLKPCLVYARHMKNVTGRRTDWHDCQWIQYLHSVGLLRGAFRPAEEICAVRAIMRHRQELVQMAAQHVQHMQKALTQMNLQIHHVINDITGLTGLAIVDAILGGERDASKLAQLRHYRIQADEETIRKSLVGNWRGEHLFALRQSREEVWQLSTANRAMRCRDRSTVGRHRAESGSRAASTAPGSERNGAPAAAGIRAMGASTCARRYTND